VEHSSFAAQLPTQASALWLPSQALELPVQYVLTVRLWASAPQPLPLQRYSGLVAQTAELGR